MLPKTIIIGVTGYLGKHFLAARRRSHADCVGTSRNPARNNTAVLDLCDPATFSVCFKAGEVQEALILAGVTKMAECEKDKERSRMINVDGTLELIKQLARAGVKPIFMSSDIIFDGDRGRYDESDVPHPLNEYGRQKAEVERGIQAICTDGNYLIIRSSKVFGLDKGDGTFFDVMAAAMSRGETVRAAVDQVFSPVCVDDLVNVIGLLQQKNASGIFHINPPETWSRYDLAMALAACLEVDPKQVEKITLGDLKEGFRRPKNTVMKADKMLRSTGYRFPPTRSYIESIARQWKLERAAHNVAGLYRGSGL